MEYLNTVLTKSILTIKSYWSFLPFLPFLPFTFLTCPLAVGGLPPARPVPFLGTYGWGGGPCLFWKSHKFKNIRVRFQHFRRRCTSILWCYNCKTVVKLKVYQGILPNYIRHGTVLQFKTLNEYNSRVRYKPNIE